MNECLVISKCLPKRCCCALRKCGQQFVDPLHLLPTSVFKNGNGDISDDALLGALIRLPALHGKKDLVIFQKQNTLG